MSEANPNQWFLDICPDDWRDKDYFIENVLFKSLIHFWENEGGEINTRFQVSIDRNEYKMTVVEYLRHIEFYQDMYAALSAAYSYAKDWVVSTEGQFVKDVDSSEETKHLQSIVKYRGKMWI